MRRVAKEVKPKAIIAGASAYSQAIDFATFREIADEVGAYLFADVAHIAGLIAAGRHPTSVGHAHITTSTAHKTLGASIRVHHDLRRSVGEVDKTVFPGMQGGPLMHVIAGKAVAFGEASQPEFKTYAKQVRANAAAMAQAFIDRDVPVITGGTDNHLFLINVDTLGISGPGAERVLDEVGISTNRNTIPGEQRSAFQTSGLRIGTPAITTRGFKEADVVSVADMMVRVLRDPDSDDVKSAVRTEVLELTSGFGVPGLE